MAREITIRILLLGLAFAALLGAEKRIYAQAEMRPGTNACSLGAKGYFTQGQPIVMRLRVENNSFESKVVDLGYDREGALQFKLKRGEGAWMDLPQTKVREGISLVGKVTIPPGETYSQQIILDDWYKFGEPGTYVVSLMIPKSICFGLELQFEITPANAESLSNMCSELVDAIRDSKKNYEKSADAAKVLAKIDDRLVVPFLAKALEANRMLDSILIPALERIGDKEAIRYLISLLEHNDSTSSKYELVRPALQRLESKSALEDAEMIRIALARFPAP
jgi:hypothetical protein